jgi:hypothetical protein
MIDPNAVHDAASDSLYREVELDRTLDDPTPTDAIVVPAVVNTYAFHPDRLESHRAEVTEWLSQLPVEFHKNSGGGWSFLNACTTADGQLWTGEHRVVEALLALGIGLGLASWQLPKELWDALPGGMPYVVVDL